MIEYRIYCLLRQLNSSLLQYGVEEGIISDITPVQGHLLYVLLQKGRHGMCSSDICAESGLSRATVSNILKLLRTKGYLKMKSLPADERKKEIILTGKAYSIEDDLRKEIEKQEKYMCEGISEDELRIMQDILERMLRNLKAHAKTKK